MSKNKFIAFFTFIKKKCVSHSLFFFFCPHPVSLSFIQQCPLDTITFGCCINRLLLFTFQQPQSFWFNKKEDALILFLKLLFPFFCHLWFISPASLVPRCLGVSISASSSHRSLPIKESCDRTSVLPPPRLSLPSIQLLFPRIILWLESKKEKKQSFIFPFFKRANEGARLAIRLFACLFLFFCRWKPSHKKKGRETCEKICQKLFLMLQIGKPKT